MAKNLKKNLFLCTDKIVKTVGEGTFGKVVKAVDLKRYLLFDASLFTLVYSSLLALFRCKNVALKLIKNVEKYRKAAKFEILVLNKLNKWDPNGKQ